MRIEQKILDKFDVLINAGRELLDTIAFTQEEVADRGEEALGRLDNNLAIKWELRCLHFLKQLCGEQHIYYKAFSSLCNAGFSYRSDLAEQALIILETANDDYETGDLIEFRTLIEAEVFGDFLEQAEHLLTQGYFTSAAVITGSVLEDSLRKLCTKYGIALSAKPKLDTMNADLTKAGVYNLLKQKQITAIADLRNKAAHSQGGFTKEDVEDMIRNVRRFMEDYFS
jgi:hypothetical protein